MNNYSHPGNRGYQTHGNQGYQHHSNTGYQSNGNKGYRNQGNQGNHQAYPQRRNGNRGRNTVQQDIHLPAQTEFFDQRIIPSPTSHLNY